MCKLFSKEIACSQDVTCVMRPHLLFDLARKEDGPRREASPLGRPGQKKRALNAGNIVQSVRSYARITNLVQVWYKVHAGSRHRPQCCLG